jgi:hypothetical protein
VSELIALAPDPRYVITVRNGSPHRPPDAGMLQHAVGQVARVTGGPGGRDHFLLALAPGGAIGAAIATLAEAGFDVLACRQERAEIEEAFLALAAEGGQ